jgi:hypothetical protein
VICCQKDAADARNIGLQLMKCGLNGESEPSVEKSLTCPIRGRHCSVGVGIDPQEDIADP